MHVCRGYALCVSKHRNRNFPFSVENNRAEIGFVLNSKYWGRGIAKEAVEKIGAKYVNNLDEFWPMCDYITLHTPKTKETTSLINRNTLNRMKKGVRIINCARGGIIDEAALKEALESGQVKAAALDVYETEPDIMASPLYGCEANVTMTPHLGASTTEAQFNVAIDVAEQIKEVLTGGSAKAAINIPALKSDILEPVKEYMQLSENLGVLVQQLSKGNLKNINITVNGNLSELNVAPLEVAIQKGIFSSASKPSRLHAIVKASISTIRSNSSSSNKFLYCFSIAVRISPKQAIVLFNNSGVKVLLSSIRVNFSKILPKVGK